MYRFTEAVLTLVDLIELLFIKIAQKSHLAAEYKAANNNESNLSKRMFSKLLSVYECT